MKVPRLNLVFAQIVGFCLTFVAAQAAIPGSTSLAGELVWWTSDFAYGKVQLGSTTRDGSYNLSRGSRWSPNLAEIKSNDYSLAESYATLRFDRQNYLGFTTSANPGSKFNFAGASVNTSDGPPHYKYIYFHVSPTGWGEYYGKPVTVTFRAHATRTLVKTDYNSYNLIELFVNGGNWARHIERSGGTKTYVPPSRTLNTTMGTWISLAMLSESYATKTNSANQELRIDISTR